jgi:serine protease Do
LSNVGQSGPAARAGLAVGDVVVEFAGSEVHSSKDLIDAVAVQPVGARVPVTYLRDGRRRQTEVQVARRPAVEEIESKLSGGGGR